MKLIEFIAEIESRFPAYSDSGDIDKVSVKFDVLQKLKSLGVNVLDRRSTVLTVENSMSRLPEGFRSLYLAQSLTPIGSKIIRGNRRDFTDNYIYRQRIEEPAWFNEITNEYVRTCKSKIVTEKITINNCEAELCYRPENLSLSKGIKKDTLDVDCVNRKINNSPYKISITGNVLNTNFNSGKIYLEYNSFPTDEDGDIVIPDYTTGDIYNYLENHVKIRIAEYLIVNNLNPTGIQSLYSVWKQEERDLKRLAMTEARFNSLSKDWNKKMKALNKMEFLKYSLPKI